MSFPADRPRRLRRTETLRTLVRETRLRPSDFVLPLFAISGRGQRKPVASMPGGAQLSGDLIVEQARAAKGLAALSLLLFAIPYAKDAQVSSAWYPNGP